MVTLTVRRVGNSLGVTLPSEAAQTLHVGEGDKLYLTEAPGGYRITAYDPEFEATMQVAEKFMGRYRNALRKLAERGASPAGCRRQQCLRFTSGSSPNTGAGPA